MGLAWMLFGLGVLARLSAKVAEEPGEYGDLPTVRSEGKHPKLGSAFTVRIMKC